MEAAILLIPLWCIMIQLLFFTKQLRDSLEQNKSALNRIATALERLLAEEDYEGDGE